MAIDEQLLMQVAQAQHTQRKNVSVEVVQQLAKGKIPSMDDVRFAATKLNASIETHRGEVESKSGRKMLADLERLLTTATSLLDAHDLQQELKKLTTHIRESVDAVGGIKGFSNEVEGEVDLEREAEEAEAIARGVGQEDREKMKRQRAQFRALSKSFRVFGGLLFRSADFRRGVTTLAKAVIEALTAKDLDTLNMDSWNSSLEVSGGKGKARAYTVEEPDDQPASTSRMAGGVQDSDMSDELRLEGKDRAAIRALSTPGGASSKRSHHFSSTMSDEQVVQAVMEVMEMIAQRPEMRRGIDAFFQISEQVWDDFAKSKFSLTTTFGASAGVGVEAGPSMEKRKTELSKHLHKVRADLLNVFACLARGRSIEQFAAAIESLSQRIASDEDVKVLIDSIKSLLDVLTRDPDMYRRPNDVQYARERIRATLTRIRMMGNRYRQHPTFETAEREGRVLLDAIRTNERLIHLAQDVYALAGDFVYSDRHDKTHFDLTTISHIRNVVASIVMDQLDFLPLPAMSGSSKKIDWAVDNLTMSARDILPEHIHIQTLSDTDLSLYSLSTAPNETIIKVDIVGLYAKLRNVCFAIEKKNWPRRSDSGTVDVAIGGEGGRLTLWLRTLKTPGLPALFTGVTVDFVISDLTLAFGTDVNHPRMLGSRGVRRRIRHAIERSVIERSTEMIGEFCGVLNRAMFSISRKLREKASQDGNVAAVFATKLISGKAAASVPFEMFRASKVDNHGAQPFNRGPLPVEKMLERLEHIPQKRVTIDQRPSIFAEPGRATIQADQQQQQQQQSISRAQ
ncbi:hypothetical protein CAOG_06152 [Capsaspora owczarzaki ATCC 30864]|uniref:HAM1-like N-terminal domain-containing protein n=1 Tax=Capsaspora owczarzaki (strain ATCC 30864) TaxID=595528 RepID=A0A0D2WTF4_CAPO3|nr:hypothetical protein CAOG_06152 [Capsaspora owczarzaki ATCC 30864]KJE95730.1 hypothetical protein CAOG_006152 [Capsaspora owczarzaki ATCC 30864]|eukprot:XP_004345742.1 hypothetical protein CAOG_06152 [Capsaspora owczarzaki ATCC 30864]